MVADIQRELLRRGFYEGAADGVYGPKTDAAIRDFEQAAGLRPSAEPNDMLLASIARSSHQGAAGRRSSATIRSRRCWRPSARIVAVQRALTDFGYGPVKPTGIYDAETRAAIERFEKARQAAGDRPDLRPAGARSRGADRPAAGVASPVVVVRDPWSA